MALFLVNTHTKCKLDNSRTWKTSDILDTTFLQGNIIPGNKRKNKHENIKRLLPVSWVHFQQPWSLLLCFPTNFLKSSCTSSKHRRLNKYLCSLHLTKPQYNYKGVYNECMHKDNGNGRVNGSNKIWKTERKWARCHRGMQFSL